MRVALISQAKKSEYDTAQPSSCIAGDNVLNEWYAKVTDKKHGIREGFNKKKPQTWAFCPTLGGEGSGGGHMAQPP